MKGDPLGKNFPEKKVSQCRKKLEGGTLWSPGMVWYAGKQEKLFWFSSLDQIVQFGAIIFCRTFKNYFGHFVWIEKKKSHYNSRVSLHEAPTKKVERKLECFGAPVLKMPVLFKLKLSGLAVHID